MSQTISTVCTLADEIKEVKQYLDNEVFRFDGRLSVEFSVDREMDGRVLVPRRLIQVFANNALRRVSLDPGKKGSIDVSVQQSGIGVLIMVVDNSMRSSRDPDQVYSKSPEIRLLDSYLPLFNKDHPLQVSYQILDRATCEEGESGYRVLITLKN